MVRRFVFCTVHSTFTLHRNIILQFFYLNDCVYFSLQGSRTVFRRLCSTPGIRRCPLPPIEPAKNGFPRSHGGRTGMNNGRAGRTPDHRLRCKPYIHKHWMPSNPAILTAALWFSVWDNDAYRKSKLQNLHTDNSRIFQRYCVDLLMQSWCVLIVRMKHISAVIHTFQTLCTQDII